jgi:hypothetical protein
MDEGTSKGSKVFEAGQMSRFLTGGTAYAWIFWGLGNLLGGALKKWNCAIETSIRAVLLNAFQSFEVDSTISTSATVPSIITSDPEVNLTSLIHHFVTQRRRHENFDIISLNGDLEIIKNTRKALLAAMSRGNWFLVHSSKPSGAGANMLVDVFTQSGITRVNTNFRMLIICTSPTYILPSIIGTAKRIHVES